MKRKIDFESDDVLIAVLACFPDRKTVGIKGVNKIKNTFYSASQKPEYFDFFKNWYFDTDGIFPSSKQFSEAWTGLVGSGGVLTEFESDYFWVNEFVRLRFEIYLKPHLNPNELDLLRKMAKDMLADLESN